jgi:UPF0716 protein FxsA
MRFLIGLILLAFPIAEIYLLVILGHRYGGWLLVYLVAVGLLGLRLIRDEKQMISAKMMQSLGAGGNPVKALLGSARNMVAGVLLLIPGVISDVIAVILLLIPLKPGQDGRPEAYSTRPGRGYHAANDEVIEGEYVEIVEENNKLPENK